MSGHPAVKLLSSYLDSEVTPAELRLVEGHLGECSECRRTVAGLRGVAEGVRRLEAVAPPASLASNVERRIASAALERARAHALEESLRRWMAQPVLAPVFAIVLALGSILYLFAFAVARDEARGTRLVIASAPTEPDSELRLGAARDARPAEGAVAETASGEAFLDQESPDQPVSSASEPPPHRSAAAGERANVGARAADPADPGETGAGRAAARSVDKARLGGQSSEEPMSQTELSAGAFLGAAGALREAGGRRFISDGAIWVEVGLEGEIADEVVDWRQVPEGRISELEAFQALGKVRVRIGDRIVEVVYPDETPRN